MVTPDQREPAEEAPKNEIIGLLKVSPHGNKDRLLVDEMLALGNVFEIPSGEHFALRFVDEQSADSYLFRTHSYVEFKGTDEYLEVTGKSPGTYSIAPAKINGEVIAYKTYVGIPEVSDAPVMQVGETLCYFSYAGSVFGRMVEETVTKLGQPEGYQSVDILRHVETEMSYLKLDDRFQRMRPFAIGPQKRMKLRHFYHPQQVTDSQVHSTHEKSSEIHEYDANARLILMLSGQQRDPSLYGFVVTHADDGIVRMHQLLRYFTRGTGKGKTPAIVNLEGVSRWFATAYSHPDNILDARIPSLSGLTLHAFGEDVYRALVTPPDKRVGYNNSALAGIQSVGYDPEAMLSNEDQAIIAARFADIGFSS